MCGRVVCCVGDGCGVMEMVMVVTLGYAVVKDR